MGKETIKVAQDGGVGGGGALRFMLHTKAKMFSFKCRKSNKLVNHEENLGGTSMARPPYESQIWLISTHEARSRKS